MADDVSGKTNAAVYGVIRRVEAKVDSLKKDSEQISVQLEEVDVFIRGSRDGNVIGAGARLDAHEKGLDEAFELIAALEARAGETQREITGSFAAVKKEQAGADEAGRERWTKVIGYVLAAIATVVAATIGAMK